MRSILKTSIAAGLIAGTVDLGAACVINRVPPGPVLRVIASGLLGSPLPHENWVYWLGMALQWAMSILIAAIFVIAAVKMPVLVRRWLAAGIAYGAVVFVVMNFLVVPLSRAKSGSMTAPSVVENLLAMMLFGLIIAYMTRRGKRAGN
jgi:hypothetical protein